MTDQEKDKVYVSLMRQMVSGYKPETYVNESGIAKEGYSADLRVVMKLGDVAEMIKNALDEVE